MVQLKKGDKARTCFGEIVTVMEVTESAVYVYEGCGTHYHPTKIWAIKNDREGK
jgi:hypothetical protein